MPPPSWVSPRSAMDTADDRRELTDGRRTSCGTAERDADRDVKFMAPCGRRSGAVYVRSIGVASSGETRLFGDFVEDAQCRFGVDRIASVLAARLRSPARLRRR